MLAYTNYFSDARVRREAEALSSRGDAVDLICLRDAKTHVGLIHEGVKLYPLAVQKHRGRSRLAYLIQYFSFFVQASLVLTWLFIKKRYDVIQVHTMPDPLVFAALVPKLLGAKVILDVHDLMPELFMSKFGVGYDHLVVRFLRWTERQSIGFANKAIAVQLPHRDILVQHGNPIDKLTILLNLPDPRVFNSSRADHRVSDGKFRLVYHGTISQRHGLEVAIRALTGIVQSTPNVELLVIGDGDDRTRLVGLVGDLGLSSFVKFSDGILPLEEIPRLVKQADIGIVPMLRDLFTKHTLPVKLLEYVELGIPVVCSRIDSVLFYFDESMVRYFEPGNVNDFAAHIVYLHRNPQERAVLVSNAQRFRNAFCWEKQKTVYYRLINSLEKKDG